MESYLEGLEDEGYQIGVHKESGLPFFYNIAEKESHW